MSAAEVLADNLEDVYGGGEDDYLLEPEAFTSLDEFYKDRDSLKGLSISLSQFTEFAFRMPAKDGSYQPFSFEGRRHLRDIYDTSAKRILLCCGRQSEKSTLLGNRIVAMSCMVPSYRALYVSPSAQQTKTFSNDRLKEPIETSPILKSFTTNMLSQNIFEKQFVNRSKVVLRYAFLNADRVRGIPTYGLYIDEFQDILIDNIPVIEQCAFHAPKELRAYVYSGTPKTLDNGMEEYREKHSTQGEWVVPCDAHGGDTGRYWNILGEKNIGKTGLICEKCGKFITPTNPDSQWAFMVKEAPFHSYRIPQLIVPDLDWETLLINYKSYPRARFYNEVLGISFDSGMRPMTQAQIRACCNPNVYMSDLEEYVSRSYSEPIYAGLDWGSGDGAYTVLSLGTYVDGKFRIFFIHRFTGEEAEPEPQMQKIIEICKTFNVRLIGADYGFGFVQNDTLLRKFGPERVQKFIYAARLNAKVRWDAKLLRWICHRTEVMSAIMNSVKRGTVIEFPRWEEFKEPYAQDMLNIYSEYSETLRMIVYRHPASKPDDSFHSILYCFLASMIVRPRPDVITPRREDPSIGHIWSNYSGTTNQG